MISDVDLQDWIPTEQPVKLYKVPRDTVIKIPGIEDFILFEHIDGIYSFCRMLTGNHKGEVAHISAFIDVFPYGKKN